MRSYGTVELQVRRQILLHTLPLGFGGNAPLGRLDHVGHWDVESLLLEKSQLTSSDNSWCSVTITSSSETMLICRPDYNGVFIGQRRCEELICVIRYAPT